MDLEKEPLCNDSEGTIQKKQKLDGPKKPIGFKVPQGVRVRRNYTGHGDSGCTDLFLCGVRVEKTHPIIHVQTEIDKCMALLGEIKGQFERKIMHNALCASDTDLRNQFSVIRYVTTMLYYLMSHVATPELRDKSKITAAMQTRLTKTRFTDEYTKILDETTTYLDSTLPPLRNFVKPPTHKIASKVNIFRTQVRAAELQLWHLKVISDREDSAFMPPQEAAYSFMNRLSSYAMSLARLVSLRMDGKETLLTNKRTGSNVNKDTEIAAMLYSEQTQDGLASSLTGGGGGRKRGASHGNIADDHAHNGAPK